MVIGDSFTDFYFTRMLSEQVNAWFGSIIISAGSTGASSTSFTPTKCGGRRQNAFSFAIRARARSIFLIPQFRRARADSRAFSMAGDAIDCSRAGAIRSGRSGRNAFADRLQKRAPECVAGKVFARILDLPD